MQKRIALILLHLLVAAWVAGQESVSFDTTKWEIRAQEFDLTTYQGKKALYLNGGMAQLKNASLKDGILEWHMAFPEQRGFTGVKFRAQDPGNCEEFYFRPHQSGNPDANQYCPVYNGLASWQLYHGAEYAVPIEYPFEEWMLVRLVISGTQAELYVDDMNTPVLHIPELKRNPLAGGVILYANMVPTYFANFSYRAMNGPKLSNEAPPEPKTEPGIIKSWNVSSSFAEEKLTGLTNLKDLKMGNLEWTAGKAEASGTVNLAAFGDFKPKEQNTVFARIVIQAASKQTKGLQLGFSDRARVYCNGQLLFAGNDAFRTRDYRYLGTIGYFDTIYLPLEQGRNEVWIAVSENFGGWGIRGRLEDRAGIKVTN